MVNNLKQTEKAALPQGTGKRTKYFLTGMIICILVYKFFKLQMENDDYFMMSNWREFLKIGFYTKDPLSMHHEYNCTLEKWLSCAIVYYINKWFGLIGFKIAITAAMAVVVYLIYNLNRYVSSNDLLSMLFATVTAFALVPYITIRPQTMTANILVLWIICLEHFMRERNMKWLIPMPFLACLDMQLHSTQWPCLFIAMLPYLADFTLEGRRPQINWKQKAELLLAALISFAVLYLNPYGAQSVFYIFRSVGDPTMNDTISELFLPSIWNTGWLIMSVALLIAFTFGDKKMPARYYLLCLGFYVFGCLHIRNAIYYYIAGSFVLCYMMRSKEIRLKYNLLPVLPIILCAAIFSSYSTKENDYIYKETLRRLATEYGVNGENIYCNFDCGSYADWAGYHPFIDGRAEVYLKKVNGVEDSFKEEMDLRHGDLWYRDFLDKYDFTYLIVEKDYEPAFYNNMLHDPDYKVLFTVTDQKTKDDETPNKCTVFAPIQSEK